MIQLEKPVLTGTMPVVWPTILDLGRDECKRILRKLGKVTRWTLNVDRPSFCSSVLEVNTRVHLMELGRDHSDLQERVSEAAAWCLTRVSVSQSWRLMLGSSVPYEPRET